jgi:hypothetical protein
MNKAKELARHVLYLAKRDHWAEKVAAFFVSMILMLILWAALVDGLEGW